MSTQAPIRQLDIQGIDPITQQVVRVLNEMGIMFPTKISQDEVKQFPLDITQVSLMKVGELHSYWTACHARDSAIHGVVIAMKRSIKFQLGQMKVILGRAKDDQAKEQANQRINDLTQQLARVDAMDAILDGVVDGHKRYADACSREISRRQIEASLSR